MVGIRTLINQLNLNALEFKTNTISANDTVTFPVKQSNSNISSLDLFPDDASQPQEGRLVLIRLNVVSGSTSTNFSVYQDSSATDINQVAKFTGAGTGNTPDSFILGQGFGVPFLNKDGENLFHVQIDETDGADSVYEVEMQWQNYG